MVPKASACLECHVEVFEASQGLTHHELFSPFKNLFHPSKPLRLSIHLQQNNCHMTLCRILLRTPIFSTGVQAILRTHKDPMGYLRSNTELLIIIITPPFEYQSLSPGPWSHPAQQLKIRWAGNFTIYCFKVDSLLNVL